MTNKKERTAKAAVVFQNDASRIKKKKKSLTQTIQAVSNSRKSHRIQNKIRVVQTLDTQSAAKFIQIPVAGE